MSSNKSWRLFTMRHPSIGALLWVCCIQYYLVQIIVALKWTYPYSLGSNTISDLGNTACGLYGERTVCSPYSHLMNISFIVLGLLMIAGAAFVYQKFQRSVITTIAFALIAIAGIGAVLVGLFPENTTSQLHIAGAALSFVLGNVALVCFGFVPDIPKPLRMFALSIGCIALIALVLFMTHSYFGLDIGGMERIVAYPQSIWLIILGTYLLKDRIKIR